MNARELVPWRTHWVLLVNSFHGKRSSDQLNPRELVPKFIYCYHIYIILKEQYRAKSVSHSISTRVLKAKGLILVEGLFECITLTCIVVFIIRFI